MVSDLDEVFQDDESYSKNGSVSTYRCADVCRQGVYSVRPTRRIISLVRTNVRKPFMKTGDMEPK
jgi:hypothetical protein